MKPIAGTKIISVLLCCYISFSVMITACRTATKRGFEPNLRSEGVDLSTPDKTIALFVEAFKVGDDKLLNEVLAPNASLPEFNPIQTIECPSPWITGFNITKLRVVEKKGQYAADSEPGDIEVHVLLRADEKLLGKNPKCIVALWQKGVYLLRSTDNKWRIVAGAPFWPEEVQKDIENLSK